MIIENHIEDQVLNDYFFIEGIIDVDSKYFINQIKKGIKQEDNMSFKTNIRDQMTSYNYFNQDKKFIEIIQKFIKYVDDRIKLFPYFLKDSWGFCVKNPGRTKLHNHPFMFSGVLYLNDHNQTLDFPSINRKVKPKKGKFVLFSSFLLHEAKTNKDKKIKYGISFNLADQA